MRLVPLLAINALLVSGSVLGVNLATSLAQSQPGKQAPPAPPEDPTKTPRVVVPNTEKGVPLPTDRESKIEAKQAQPATKPEAPSAKPETPAAKLEPKADHDHRHAEVKLTPQQEADEKSIRELGESLGKAYETGNAQAAAAHYTPDAEYVGEHGHVCRGRQEIQDCLAEFFGDHPSCKLEFNIHTIRFVAQGIAIEDGTARIVHGEDGAPVETCYTSVHVKQADGKWLTVSLRDRAPKHQRQHASELRQLDWLLGDWVDEGDDATVMFACQSVDGGNYLERKFTVQISGQDAMSGTQRIGWDPTTNRFRVWLFDSMGGYADGTFRKDGGRWILQMSGITADGQRASGTSIYTSINDHTMTWQNVDHEVGDERIPDTDEVTIVRLAPKPGIDEKIANPKLGVEDIAK